MKILVIGDSCEDIYIYGKCDRLCPDAPVPVFTPVNTVATKGMAYNVYNNVISLGVECDIITNKKPITKTRYVDDKTNQMLVRVDVGDNNIDSINLSQLLLSNYDGIIISDYIKGFLSDSDIEYICKNHNNVLIDTKRLLGEYCQNAKFIKVNELEYKHSEHLLSNLNLENSLIITLGSKGCKHKNKTYPVKKVEMKDQTGAGDTFVAGLMVKYLNSNNIDEAIKFANQCATEVVQKRGVNIVTLSDLGLDRI